MMGFDLKPYNNGMVPGNYSPAPQFSQQSPAIPAYSTQNSGIVPANPMSKYLSSTSNASTGMGVQQNQGSWMGNAWGGIKKQFGEGGIMDGFFGGTDKKTGNETTGWGIQGLQAASGLMGAWNGMKQMDLAEEQFDFQKSAYNQNYANQKKLTNSRLEDRQRARQSADSSGSYESVGSYMKKNGI